MNNNNDNSLSQGDELYEQYLDDMISPWTAEEVEAQRNADHAEHKLLQQIAEEELTAFVNTLSAKEFLEFIAN